MRYNSYEVWKTLKCPKCGAKRTSLSMFFDTYCVIVTCNKVNCLGREKRVSFVLFHPTSEQFPEMKGLISRTNDKWQKIYCKYCKTETFHYYDERIELICCAKCDQVYSKTELKKHASLTY